MWMPRRGRPTPSLPAPSMRVPKKNIGTALTLPGYFRFSLAAVRSTATRLRYKEPIAGVLVQHDNEVSPARYGAYSFTSHEVQLSPLVPGCAAAGSPFSHSQVSVAEGSAPRGTGTGRR